MTYPIKTAFLCMNCGENIVALNAMSHNWLIAGKQLKCSGCRSKKSEYKNMTYRNYLTTVHWQQMSRAIRTRDGGKCRVCNRGGLTDVHHSTYENLGNESPTDLLTLCRQCHGLFEAHKLITAPKTVKVLTGIV